MNKASSVNEIAVSEGKPCKKGKAKRGEDVDISERNFWKKRKATFEKLLIDHTTSKGGETKNIFWATHSYEHLGEGYQYHDEIKPELITDGEKGKIIQPRVLKSLEEQTLRVKDKGEVFTPSWVCNAQNNLIDEAWFGRNEVFNSEVIDDEGRPTWESRPEPISFEGTGKTWQDYVCERRLEITCGEAPYLASRYDTVTGRIIPVADRIGLLDRKLRVVSENVHDKTIWMFWAKVALSSIYGYEWQGDSLLLAREALFFTVIDFYKAKFEELPNGRSMPGMAYIISWNLWQMDGLRCVVPDTCHPEKVIVENKQDLFPESLPTEIMQQCPGCTNGTLYGHNGIECLVAEWNVDFKNRKIRQKDKCEFKFSDLLSQQQNS